MEINKTNTFMLTKIMDYERSITKRIDDDYTPDDMLAWILALYIDENIRGNKNPTYGSIGKVINDYQRGIYK